MYQEERMEAVLKYLEKNKKMSIQDMCEHFGVSRDTARRDTVKLTEKEAVVRTHGGVMLPGLITSLKGYTERLEKSAEEKMKIANTAAKQIIQEEVIMLDASTTVQFTSELVNVSPLTVITNSIVNAETITEKRNIDIHLPGGRLNVVHRFLYGSSTVEKIHQFYADKAFIGVIGICNDGLYYAHEEDAAVKKAMAERSETVYVLADSTKFGKRHFIKGLDLEDVDCIITDKQPGEELAAVFQENGIKLLIADS
ncbi:DeoR/GlpR family DNA-binding transcription regulator [Alteribacillus sp. HJP-4]|uniref:DeoR/GlpR family DNA-binding transcription regulator n=1 Tax=Alteribacillus sp. HJP-4 TaxID=2775394 RepID=UPI0035CCF888